MNEVTNFDLSLLQDRIHHWTRHNFKGRTPCQDPQATVDRWKPLLGAQEELGELCHAVLKQMQGIRGSSEDHEAAAKDAVGDIVIYLADFCTESGWDFGEVVSKAAEEVLARDWITYPSTGRPKEESQ